MSRTFQTNSLDQRLGFTLEIEMVPVVVFGYRHQNRERRRARFVFLILILFGTQVQQVILFGPRFVVAEFDQFNNSIVTRVP